MTVLTVPPELQAVEIGLGSHPTDDAGDCLCFMEAVARLAGEGRTDHPACADTVITRLGNGINDAMSWTSRQSLKVLAPFVVGTAGDGLAEQRLAFAMRWMVAELAPALLGRLGLWDRADELTAYHAVLPLQLPPHGASWAPNIWGGPLGALQHARMALHLGQASTDRAGRDGYEQECLDVEAMLTRIITALTDYSDPTQFGDRRILVEHVATLLEHVFVVHLSYPYHRIEILLTRFISELIFTGRSYL